MSVVRLGEHNLEIRDNKYRKDYNVERFINHNDYSPSRRIHDIALIKLTRDVEISTKVRPACLHQKPEIKLMGNTVIAIGFGNTGYADDQSQILLKVALSVINPNSCKKWVNTRLLTTQLCIQGAGDADTCSGELFSHTL